MNNFLPQVTNSHEAKASSDHGVHVEMFVNILYEFILHIFYMVQGCYSILSSHMSSKTDSIHSCGNKLLAI